MKINRAVIKNELRTLVDKYFEQYQANEKLYYKEYDRFDIARKELQKKFEEENNVKLFDTLNWDPTPEEEQFLKLEEELKETFLKELNEKSKELKEKIADTKITKEIDTGEFILNINAWYEWNDDADFFTYEETIAITHKKTGRKYNYYNVFDFGDVIRKENCEPQWVDPEAYDQTDKELINKILPLVSRGIRM